MQGFMLANFLDPIAKVWSNARPPYPATHPKVKRPKQKKKNKKSK